MTEIEALKAIIEALRELPAESRDRVIETAKVFCNGLAPKPRRGRPKKTSETLYDRIVATDRTKAGAVG